MDKDVVNEEREGVGLPEGLALVEECPDWNVYRDEDGGTVYLQHGTGLRLVAFDEVDLSAEWHDFEGRMFNRHGEFLDWLRATTYEPDFVDEVEWCSDCEQVQLREIMLRAQGDRWICGSCAENEYVTCARCAELAREVVTALDDDDICPDCRSGLYSYCSDCEGWYRDDGDADHTHSNDDCPIACVSPQLAFEVRNDGAGPLANDVRATVTLAAGTISEEGAASVADYLRAVARGQRTFPFTPEGDEAFSKWWQFANNLEPLGQQWQTKEGNYTKRLSRHAHKNHGLKVSPDMLSAVGNIASEHSQAVNLEIEVTRDLNLGPEEFANEESCWWQSYYHGRCALKSNGGFGLRAFDEYDYAIGRAWVLPLRKGPSCQPRALTPACGDTACTECRTRTSGGGFGPTFDALTPDAFAVFNGYGTLSGYAPARALAHMAGWTYRKIAFTCKPMYVNGNTGYLIGPEALVEPLTDGALDLDVEQHADLYGSELRARARARANAHHETESRETVHA